MGVNFPIRKHVFKTPPWPRSDVVETVPKFLICCEEQCSCSSVLGSVYTLYIVNNKKIQSFPAFIQGCHLILCL